MGKSAPKPPDPEKTASAQTATNVNTAIANSFMGNVNQVTPDGSLTYSQTGTYKMTDPLSGKVYDLPTWTATQSLSDAQKAIKTQNDAASLNLSKLANTQSGRLNDLLSSPVNTGGLPAWGDPSKIANPNYTKFQNGPDLQTSLKDAGAIQSNVAGAGKIQTQLGDYGSVGSQIADAGKIQTDYITDFSGDRQKVEDALMARMNPQLQQDRAALEQRLANQGLQPGSEAYNRAVDEANRSASDARYGAILNAGQEQSRLANLARDAATFKNSAQQQQFGQNLTGSQFANDAQQQRFSQGLAGAQFGNSAQQQQYGQNLSNAEFSNQAQQQKFAQGLAGAEFGNSAKQQMYGNQNTATAANNALQDQGFNSQMAKTNAMNQQRQLQLQEAYAQRNQPINEISALLSGSQVSNPQFMNIQGQTMPTVDYAGIVANNHNQQMAAYNANQSNIGGLLGGLASIFTKSDDRTKKNKTRHGDVKGKMGVWSFNYKDEPAGTPRHVGLMASEVEKEVPSAIKRRNGIRYVNYEKALGGK
jgi:ribosomal protein S8